MPRPDWKGSNPPKIGYLHVGAPPTGPAHATDHLQEGFEASLRRLGYFPQNTWFRWYYANWDDEILRDYAKTLAIEPVDVLVTADSLALQATAAALQGLAARPPIVMAICGDLDEEAWHRKIGAIGLTNRSKKQMADRVRWLLQVRPAIASVAVLYNPADLSATAQAEEAVRQLNAQVPGHHQAGFRYALAASYEGAKAEIANSVASAAVHDALLVVPDPLTARWRQEIVQAVKDAEATKPNGWPAIYPHRDFVLAGGLMSYGANRYELMDRVGEYVDHVLTQAPRPSQHDPLYVEIAIRTDTKVRLSDTIRHDPALTHVYPDNYGILARWACL